MLTDTIFKERNQFIVVEMASNQYVTQDTGVKNNLEQGNEDVWGLCRCD